VSDSPKPVLHPTKNRLRLMGWIVSKSGVKHWHFIRPDTYDVATNRKVTDRVAELVRAGLAEIPAPDEFNTSMVRLTEAGQQYLDTYGKNGATS
jgi:hypothetical protein